MYKKKALSVKAPSKMQILEGAYIQAGTKKWRRRSLLLQEDQKPLNRKMQKNAKN